jgi:putative endonuclease
VCWRSLPMAKRARIRAYRFGLLAEYRVMLRLLLRGYRLRGHRVKTPMGELDLVYEKNGALVFVEVKARARLDDACFALQPHQQARLQRAAGYFIARRPHYMHHSIRFDCCAVSWYMRVNHIRNAF